MEKFKIFFKKSALKELENLPTKKVRVEILSKINALADDPFPSGAKKLSGTDKYRIRHGSYRILYSIVENEVVIFIVKIGNRGDVYKKGLR